MRNSRFTPTGRNAFPSHILALAPGPRRLVSKPPMLRSGVAVWLTKFLDSAESYAPRDDSSPLQPGGAKKFYSIGSAIVRQTTVLSTTRFRKAVGSGAPNAVRPELNL